MINIKLIREMVVIIIPILTTTSQLTIIYYLIFDISLP